MKVTKPMIERAAVALDERDFNSSHEMAEAALRAALNDPKDAVPVVIPGQTDIYEQLRGVA